MLYIYSIFFTLTIIGTAQSTSILLPPLIVGRGPPSLLGTSWLTASPTALSIGPRRLLKHRGDHPPRLRRHARAAKPHAAPGTTLIMMTTTPTLPIPLMGMAIAGAESCRSLRTRSRASCGGPEACLGTKRYSHSSQPFDKPTCFLSA